MDSDELYYAYMVFPYVLMYVVRNPSVPDWDRDGNLTLPAIYIYIYMGPGLVAGGPEIAPKLTWTSSIGPLVIESKNG